MKPKLPKTYIIAEAGVNHNGDIALAKKMIEAAHTAGADAVKFQTFKSEKLVTTKAAKASYQKMTTAPEESQMAMLQQLELSTMAHAELYEHSKQVGIEFLSSPFDLESLEFLIKLGVDKIKIPSGEIVNIPFLRKIGASQKKIILSTGMSCLGEIEKAINVIVTAGTPKKNITVLHCNTEYPSPMCDINLKAMQTIGNAFNVEVGYSDHTLGIEIAIAAVAMGAIIIEKHFTLDRSLPGPDQKASLSPHDFLQMTKSIRNVEVAMGDGVKRVSPSEAHNLKLVRKYIVAKRNIQSNELFSNENLCTKRTGKGGCSAALWDKLIGQKAPKAYIKDEIIHWLS